jgi:ketosteroid isomerase-like protein
MATEETRRFLRAWFDAVERGDGAAAMAALSDDILLEVPEREHGQSIAWGGCWRGKAQAGEAFRVRDQAIDVLEFALLDLLVEGERAVALSRERNRDKASGETHEIGIIQWIEVRNGMICRIRAFDDPWPVASGPGSTEG